MISVGAATVLLPPNGPRQQHGGKHHSDDATGDVEGDVERRQHGEKENPAPAMETGAGL